jgi:hypothetical protein
MSTGIAAIAAAQKDADAQAAQAAETARRDAEFDRKYLGRINPEWEAWNNEPWYNRIFDETPHKYIPPHVDLSGVTGTDLPDYQERLAAAQADSEKYVREAAAAAAAPPPSPPPPPPPPVEDSRNPPPTTFMNADTSDSRTTPEWREWNKLPWYQRLIDDEPRKVPIDHNIKSPTPTSSVRG